MRGRLLVLVACAAILIFPLALVVADQDTHIEEGQSLCPFKMLTGFPCPGCGITKSLVFLYRGDLEKSFAYHLFGPPVFLVSLVGLMLILYSFITKRTIVKPKIFGKKTAYIIASTLFIYHACRLVYFITNHSWESILRESIWL